MAIIVVGVILFTIGLWDREFIRIHARYGMFMKEMAAHGIGLHPTLYGEPYPDYYSTQIVLSLLCSKLFGQINFLTAVLPSAVASAFCLAFVYLIGSEVSRKLGFCAVMICLMTYGFVYDARSPTPDQFIAAITAFCFYLLIASKKGVGWREYAVIPVCLAAGFALRGPIGVVIPAAVVFAFHLVEREWRKLILMSVVSAVVLGGCFGAVALCAYDSQGTGSLISVIDAQVLGRLVRKSGSAAKASKPVYFYLANGVWWHAMAFPLAILSLIFGWRSGLLRSSAPETRLWRHLAGWFLIVLAGMSVPGMKQMRYILPLIPAAALLGAFLFVLDEKTAIWRLIRKVLVPLLMTAPFVGVVVALVARQVIQAQLPGESFPALKPVVIFFVLGALSVFAWIRYRRRIGEDLLALSVGAASFLAVHLLVIEGAELTTEKSAPFVQKAELARGEKGQLVFWRIGPDGEDVKYMVNIPRLAVPEFLSGEPEEMTAIPPGAAVFISNRDEFESLPEKISDQFETVVEGRLGHTSCVGFIRPPSVRTKPKAND